MESPFRWCLEKATRLAQPIAAWNSTSGAANQRLDECPWEWEPLRSEKAQLGANLGGGDDILGEDLLDLDDLSETTLVRLTSVWFFPLVFGSYGLVAEKLLQMIDEKKADSLAGAAAVYTRALGLLGWIPLFPFLFLKGKSSVSVAFWGALVWAVLLTIFFEGIFPNL